MKRTERTLHFRLPRRPESPTEARRRLAELGRQVEHSTLAKVRLLVTELVANSFKYSRGGDIVCQVVVSGELVRAEVADGGPGFDVPRGPHHLMRTDGWGLVLVRRIADRWGTSNGGTRVWFEIEQPPSGAGDLRRRSSRTVPSLAERQPIGERRRSPSG
jgi:anti-sigma regulatory factor (Ser/Thr protein kinase)